jgi:UPF0716 protein FxsA
VAKLILLFTLVPLIELYLLMLIGGWLGLWPTVAMVVVTGLVGAWLARMEGLRVLRQWQQSLAEGRMPAEGVLGGVLLLVGGVLLITPGVLTDVVGLSLLVPASRRQVSVWLRPWIERRIQRGIERGTVQVVRMGAADRFDDAVDGWRDDVERRDPNGPRIIDVDAEVSDQRRGGSDT